MSGFKNKTPSESYKDLLVVGENLNGLTDSMSPITDGVGNPTKILSSLNSSDIDFNGGYITSFISNSECRGLKITNIEYSSTQEVIIGNPGTEFFSSMFYPDPDPGAVSPCGDSFGNTCRVVNIVLKKPLSLDLISEASTYAKTDLFLARDGNNVRYDFSSANGYKIIGIDSYHSTSRGFDWFKVEFINNSMESIQEIHISLIKENIFNTSFEAPVGKSKSLCEPTWSLYEDFSRKGNVIKAATPLAKASPGGSYRDLLCLNTDNTGLTANEETVTDGDGVYSKIQLSSNHVSIDCNGGSLTDPVLSSYHESFHEVNIIDSQSEYDIENLNSNHILINRKTTSSEELEAYLTINIDNLPQLQSTNPNLCSLVELVFSYSAQAAGYSPTVVYVRLSKNGINTSYYSIKIADEDVTYTSAKTLFVLFKDVIQEVIET